MTEPKLDDLWDALWLQVDDAITRGGWRLDEGTTEAVIDKYRPRIEAEARAAALDEARAAVEGLTPWDKRTVPGGLHVHRGQALAAIDTLRERSGAPRAEDDLPDHEPDCPMFDHPNDKTAPACTCSWRERSGE